MVLIESLEIKKSLPHARAFQFDRIHSPNGLLNTNMLLEVFE